MRPKNASLRLHAMLRAEARMFEFNVPEVDHIDFRGADPDDLFPLVIGTLGDEAARFAAIDLNLIEGQLRLLPEDSAGLRFAANFFNAYLNAKKCGTLHLELLLLGAATYYLADFSGSAVVLIRQAQKNTSDRDDWLTMLEWLLAGSWEGYFLFEHNWYSALLTGIGEAFADYFLDGYRREELIKKIDSLRFIVYERGTARELLLADVICAVVKKRLRNSTRETLPIYTGLPADRWQEIVNKPGFMKELWPSQHMFGERGVLRGLSSIIQMPTSAGKTKGIELVIRSAFSSGRASFSVVVAPFRALCSEITNSLREAFVYENVEINELSDSLQVDYSNILSDLLELDLGSLVQQRVAVVTPEKLLYILRHNPDLIQAIGLVIYDEGHQFDNGSRGVVYELLLTSIKELLSERTQILLISAVIQNVEDVGSWLIGEQAEILRGIELSTTDRATAFVSWTTNLGQLYFVEPSNPNDFDYFVPRIIEQQKLETRSREKERFFPIDGSPNSIALYLGLQVVRNGSVAIFCGTKVIALSMTKALVDAYERGLALTAPVAYSDTEETKKLANLYASHFGQEAEVTRCAALGVFSHHGNTPHGIRLAVEHAMKDGLIKFVLCTSTLAQGVNLPIRYLIISGTMQGDQRIKVKDFHNLLGRAGRAGMYTEGTVLFSDPSIFDKREMKYEKWRWDTVSNLLNPINAEPTESSLLGILAPFKSVDGRAEILTDMADLLETAMENPEEVFNTLTKFAEGHQGYTSASLHYQLTQKLKLMEALQSYLMSHRGNESFEVFLSRTDELVKATLAYHLADDDQKSDLVKLFSHIAKYIEKTEEDVTRQAVYGRTLLGIRSATEIWHWVIDNAIPISVAKTDTDLFSVIWPLLRHQINEELFHRCAPESVVYDLAAGWISGKSFEVLFKELNGSGGKKQHGNGTRKLTLNDVVNLCENALGYESTLIVAAVIEFIAELQIEHADELMENLETLQKRLKYGVHNICSIRLYELGFADRVIAMDIAELVNEENNDQLVTRLRDLKEDIENSLKRYPCYFESVYANLTVED